MPTVRAYPSSLSPEYPLLGLLLQRPAHGYELHTRLVADLANVWRISLSQTYNILGRLEARGFIRGRRQQTPHAPARRLFHLTPPGRRHFEQWLHKPSGTSVRAIRVEFITRLYFMLARDQESTRRLVDEQIAGVRARLDGLDSALRSLPAEQTFERLSLDFRVRQIKSTLNWLLECRATLDLQRPS